MRPIVISLIVGLSIARAHAQDTNAPAPATVPTAAATNAAAKAPNPPSLPPPPDQTPSAPTTPPAPASTPAPAPAAPTAPPAPVPPPPPAPATPPPAPAPAPVTTVAPPPAPATPAPAPAPAPAPSTASTPAPAPPAPSQPAQATTPDHFHPDAILNRCVDGVSFSQERFNKLFSYETFAYTGTVADINHDEHLIVFQGGGTFPDNWDLQLKPHGFRLVVGHTYHITFRLTHVRDEPLAGYSFRGIVLTATRTSAN